MSLFKKEPDPPASSAPRPSGGSAPRRDRPGAQAPRERPVSRIAQGTRVTGEVAGATELSVEGEVEGTLRVESRVSIAAGGVVRGEIHARSVLVGGEVHGDVHGTERVEVGASGTLEGDISAPRVTIAEGAFFKGKVEMTGKDGGRRSDRPAGRAGGEGAGKQGAPKHSGDRRADRPGGEGAPE